MSHWKFQIHVVQLPFRKYRAIYTPITNMLGCYVLAVTTCYDLKNISLSLLSKKKKKKKVYLVFICIFDYHYV